MNTAKSLSLIIILLLAVQGCIEESPGEQPLPATSPNATVIVEPTETVRVTPSFTPEVTPDYDNGIPITHILWIDSASGFKKIRAFRNNTNVPLPPDLNILNFSIKKGDSVRWVNDDIYNLPLTLVSNEGLWANRTAYLRWQNSRFEYSFNKSGTYSFSIKEYPRIRNQTITVI